MLGAAAGSSPVGERFQVVAIFPGELEKFASVEFGSVFAKEGFKAPLDIGAFPGLKAVSAGSKPVEF
ncbi:MAG: hypothetical protein WBQ89_12590 [Candidatus Acidiferrum sp.]